MSEPRMGIEEFLEELAKTPRDWYYRGNAIRRNYCGGVMDDGDVCPILAVAAVMSEPIPCDNSGNPKNWVAVEVGARMNISRDDCLVIMTAADRSARYSNESDLLRQKLMVACGLEER